MKKLKYVILIFILFIITLEIIFRLLNFIFPAHPHQRYDNKLGWKIRENVSLNYSKKGIGEVSFTTQKNGFRIWGNPQTKRKKILIIGDSYTEALQISDGKAYYDYLKNDSTELFVHGCGGYGTLQESLVLDNYIDEIKPDLILWQFCHNDLINNSLELEKASYINNYLMKKPYLIDDKVIYTTPIDSKMILLLEDYFTIFKWVHLRYLILKYRYFGSIETEFDMNNPLFKKSYDITKSIYSKQKEKFPNIILFSVSTAYGYYEIETICKELKIPFISKVNTVIDSVTLNGVKTNFRPYDWHWNEKGHQLAGEILKEEIKDYL